MKQRWFLKEKDVKLLTGSLRPELDSILVTKLETRNHLLSPEEGSCLCVCLPWLLLNKAGFAWVDPPSLASHIWSYSNLYPSAFSFFFCFNHVELVDRQRENFFKKTFYKKEMWTVWPGARSRLQCDPESVNGSVSIPTPGKRLPQTQLRSKTVPRDTSVLSFCAGSLPLFNTETHGSETCPAWLLFKQSERCYSRNEKC